MARLHYWQYIVDAEGRPLENVNIRFYLNDNPTQEADIFTHPTLGSTTTTSTANKKTDGNGFFEFWVGDEFEDLGGYSSTQQFRLAWERAGILLGSISNIDVFPPLFQVDETDNTSSTKDEKNKTISNALAYKWDYHADSTHESSIAPHDFQPVDDSKTDTVYNKMVSNSLMNYLLSAIASAGTLSIESTAAIERNFSVTSWTATGSNYYANLNHFIGRQYPIVQIRDSISELMINPMKVIAVDTNQIRIFLADNPNVEVTIVG
jgi:hypothetical protein